MSPDLFSGADVGDDIAGMQRRRDMPSHSCCAHRHIHQMTSGNGIAVIDTILTSVFAFAATNIDDLLVLTILFSQAGTGLKKRQVVVGQYLGFCVLLGISMAGFFGGHVMPRAWIGCLGFVPIGIGIRRWIFRNRQVTPKHTGAISMAGVVMITLANGGDNVGIYTPLFASCDGPRLAIMLVTSLALLAPWCLVADAMSRHPAVAKVFTRYGHIIVPFVLVGIGVEIIVETGALALFGL